MPRTMKEKMYSISNLPIVTTSDNSGTQWIFVVGYIIASGYSKLYNKEIRLPAFLNGIKYIRAGKSSDIAWGQLTPPKRNPASVSCKCLPATTVPSSKDLLPAGQSRTMPSLPAKSSRQVLCQAEKIFCWGQLTPPRDRTLPRNNNKILYLYNKGILQYNQLLTHYATNTIHSSTTCADSIVAVR